MFKNNAVVVLNGLRTNKIDLTYFQFHHSKHLDQFAVFLEIIAVKSVNLFKVIRYIASCWTSHWASWIAAVITSAFVFYFDMFFEKTLNNKCSIALIALKLLLIVNASLMILQLVDAFKVNHEGLSFHCSHPECSGKFLRRGDVMTHLRQTHKLNKYGDEYKQYCELIMLR